MKRIVFVLIVLYICTIAAYGQIKVTALKGDVQIRHGASETWQQVSVGDILKPDDSMKSGKLSSATVMLDDGKKLTVPEQVIVDISDLRNLTQEDFLLKLAMEQVRSISLPAQDQPLNLPSTTTLHGTQQGMSDITAKNPEIGVLELNGTKVLFDNGYNATGVLKTKQVYRLYPALAKKIESRLLVASGFEQLNLLRDALTEYRGLLKESLSPEQRSAVQQHIEVLQKKIEG